jgi:hypothetical protein
VIDVLIFILPMYYLHASGVKRDHGAWLV